MLENPLLMMRPLLQSPLPLEQNGLRHAYRSPSVSHEQRQGLQLAEEVEMLLNKRFNLYTKGCTTDLKNRFETAISQINRLKNREDRLTLNRINRKSYTLGLQHDAWPTLKWELDLWEMGRPLEMFVTSVELLAQKLTQFNDDPHTDGEDLSPLIPLQDLEHALMRRNKRKKHKTLLEPSQLYLNL